MKDEAQHLIDILLNRKAPEDERDDAAMDLGLYDDDGVLQALILVGSDPEEISEIVLNSCGESIATILIKRKQNNKLIFDYLSEIARKAAASVIEKRAPDWLHE